MEGFELRDLDVEEIARNPVIESYEPREYAIEKGYALPIDTVSEHVSRHDGNTERILNEDYRDGIKAELDDGDWYLEVWNNYDGDTDVVFGSPGRKGAETVYHQRIGKLVSREKGIDLATRMLLGTLEKRADGGSELEVLADQLEDMGENTHSIASSYVEGEINRPYDVLIPFTYFFELKPHQKATDSFHQLEREIPFGAAETGKEKMRNRFWLEKYLGRGIKSGLERFSTPDLETDQKLRSYWLSGGLDGIETAENAAAGVVESRNAAAGI